MSSELKFKYKCMIILLLIINIRFDIKIKLYKTSISDYKDTNIINSTIAKYYFI